MSNENKRIPPVWVLVNKDGEVTLCGYSGSDAAERAALWDRIYWGDAPHRAVCLVEGLPAQSLTDEQIDDAARAPLNALLDFIYEHGTNSEGTDRLARKISRAAVAEFCRVNGITLEGGAQ